MIIASIRGSHYRDHEVVKKTSPDDTRMWNAVVMTLGLPLEVCNLKSFYKRHSFSTECEYIETKREFKSSKYRVIHLDAFKLLLESWKLWQWCILIVNGHMRKKKLVIICHASYHGVIKKLQLRLIWCSIQILTGQQQFTRVSCNLCTKVLNNLKILSESPLQLYVHRSALQLLKFIQWHQCYASHCNKHKQKSKMAWNATLSVILNKGGGIKQS